MGGAVPFSLRRFAATLLGALALVPVLAAPASEDLLRPCRSESGESLSAACQAAVAGAPFDSLARAVPAWLGERRHAHALRVLDEALRRPALDALTRQRLLELRSLAEEQAWSEGRRAPSAASGDAEWVLAQARCTRLSGAAGLAACEQALRLRPDDASTLAARGDHLFTLGRAAEAEETYRAAAARDPALRLEQKIASAHALRAPAATPSGEPAAAADALPAIAFGRYHALVIGNDDYRHLPALRTAVHDARVLAELLRSRYAFAVTLLTNATRAEVVETLDELRERLQVNDNLLIYYAGHGWLDNEADKGFWLPVDAREDRRTQWISNDTVRDALRALKAKHVLVVADSCFSGALMRGLADKPQRGNDYLQRMARTRSRQVLSSGGLEPVADAGSSGHSPFAAALIAALRGNRGVLDATTLYGELRRPVALNADQVPQFADIRMAGHEGGDFLFVPTK